MPLISESDLLKLIKKKELKNIYYFYGKDVNAVENYTNLLIKSIVKSENEIYNLHRFNEDNFDLSEISDSADMLPMMSDYICITVNDLNCENITANDLEILLSIVSAVPATTVIIIYITGFDICDGKKFPTAKNKKLIDAVSKIGTVCDFTHKKPAELSKSAMIEIEKNGASISKENAVYLASKVLSNTLLLKMEIKKLCSYANGREITSNDIDLLVSDQYDSTSFDLAKAVVNLDSKKAFELLNNLFSQRIEAIPIISAISMSFNDLYRAKTAMLTNKSANDVITDFKYPKNRAFAVENAFRDVRKSDIKHIRKCISLLAEADLKLKSSLNDQRLIIEETLAKMIYTEHKEVDGGLN